MHLIASTHSGSIKSMLLHLFHGMSTFEQSQSFETPWIQTPSAQNQKKSQIAE